MTCLGILKRNFNAKRQGTRPLIWTAAFAAVWLALVTPLSADPNGIFELRGHVRSGELPISFADVRVFEAWQRNGTPRLLGKTKANERGFFRLAYRGARLPNPVVYVIASGPAGPRAQTLGTTHSKTKSLRFATVLGDPPRSSNVVINERTTVATAYAMAQFIGGRNIGGHYPGLQNAAATLQNLADIETGGVGLVLNSAPNAGETSTRATFNSLANMIAACVRDHRDCRTLYRLAMTPRGREPTNTLDAMVNIAHHPGRSEQIVEKLLALAQEAVVYRPALEAEAIDNDRINSWVLGVRYIGGLPNGQRMNGPGNVVFDSLGNAWANSNYQFSDEQNGSSTIVCGGTQVIKMTPTGGQFPGAPFGGPAGVNSGDGAGGVYGSGFGLTLDPDENAWVPSFGFQGEFCPNDIESLYVSVGKFAPDGTTISTPDGDPANNTPGGFGSQNSDANMEAPQGIVSDRDGNIWIANCHNGSVTRFRLGDPNDAQNFPDLGLDQPFDLAIDAKGHPWVTANGNSTVIELNKQGKIVGQPVTESDGIKLPMGIAVDSRGNLWVSNSGIPAPPCPALLSDFADPSDEIGEDGEFNDNASVTLIQPGNRDGQGRRIKTFNKIGQKLSGLRWPWGISVDGKDTVWVANFAGRRIMQLCGNQLQSCNPGSKTGDAISLQDGYFSDALKRVTAVEIDPSGNLWATNNWELNGFLHPENPGGKSLVVFIGLAAPIKTPLIGPPEQPDSKR